MEINQETQNKIQNIQALDQNLQNLLGQKQLFQLEINETENALKEVKKTKNDIFKITGQVMLKTTKQDIEKDLKEKNDVLKLRLKAIEKQETIFREQLERIKSEVMGNIGEQ